MLFKDSSLRDEPRPGNSSDLDQDSLRELLQCNQRKSTPELALDLNTSQSTICCHLKKEMKSEQAGYLGSSYSLLKDLIAYLLLQVFFQGREMNHFSRISLQMSLSWQCSTQKCSWVTRLNLYTANSKCGTSWKETYTMCMMGSLNSSNMYIYENCPQSLVGETLSFSLLKRKLFMCCGIIPISIHNVLCR